MKKVKEKEWIDATGKYFPERKKGKESCKCGHERERHKSKYHMITCEICECDDYTPSGKDSAGKTKNREVGCKQQAPEDGNLSNAPLTPFEEMLTEEGKYRDSGGAAARLWLKKHRELCHEIDPEKLAEWLYEWDKKRLDDPTRKELILPAWKDLRKSDHAIYIKKAKEAINHAKK